MTASRYINPLLGKALVIGSLTIVLLLPLAQVRHLVFERSGLRQVAVDKIAAGWGGVQVIGPPILSVPCEVDASDRGRPVRIVAVHRMLASVSSLRGEMKPDLRNIGIYSVPVYQARLQIEATFDAGTLDGVSALSARGLAKWDEASIFVPIADLRGIREIVSARWGDERATLQPAAYDGLHGVSARVDLATLRRGGPVVFSMQIELAGSGGIRALPLARTMTVQLHSTWPHPGFDGAFLPASRKIDAQGFTARWQVLELNRDFPKSWTDLSVGREALLGMAFGVNLYQPVDTYQRNERAIKYALLFIALTFMSVFLWEQVSVVRIHALQYLFAGLSLCVFYLLLLALSEHVSFGWAYFAAAAAQAILIGVYLGSGLRSRRAGIIAGVSLSSVFGLMYLLILSEQYALLLGAMLLFAVLAALMLVTRYTDWYELSSRAPRELEDGA